MGKLFGTDGIRGVVGENLTAEMAFRVGQAVACVLAEDTGRRPVVLIGKDTRISSDMLESALMAGICSVGGDVKPVGTIPTPAVAYLARQEGADAGIVLSASHNPYEHNGIKVFSGQGYKLSDAVEARIEEKILSSEPMKLRARGTAPMAPPPPRHRSSLAVSGPIRTSSTGTLMGSTSITAAVPPIWRTSPSRWSGADTTWA